MAYTSRSAQRSSLLGGSANYIGSYAPINEDMSTLSGGAYNGHSGPYNSEPTYSASKAYPAPIAGYSNVPLQENGSGYPYRNYSQPDPEVYPPLPGGYHDRQGLATTSTPGMNTHRSAGLQAMMYWPSTLWTWTFFLLAAAQAVICLALEAYVFGRFEAGLQHHATENANGTSAPASAGPLTIPTYLTIFIFGFLYQLVLVWDALRLKNTIQVIGICIYNLGMLIYASVEIDQVNEAVDQLVTVGDIEPGTWPELEPFLIAAPCVLALGTVLLTFVAWKLYAEFAWTIYKHISADLRLKRRYLTYQIYIALLKFDFFFFAGFTVQFLVIVGPHTQTYEYALTIAALPITVALLFFAAYITRLESKPLQIGTIIIYFAGMAYFIFKLVRMYDSPVAFEYSAARHSLTTFAVLTLLLLVVTIAAAIMVLRNFGKGLRPHIQRRKVPDAGDVKYSNWERVGSGNQHMLGGINGGGGGRMTID